ncbi:MAG: efflux RND transporter permease subunit, partial [Elusimicrobiota bacterium]|nr:efflux RND transporter permease subunit [Elusimicrobiota bacterium]
MSLSDNSIKNPVFAWMVVLGIIVFGLVAFSRLGISQLPDVDYPVLSISCGWEGASPEVMETEVTNAIEDAIMGIEGVQEVTSSSRRGSTRVSVTFDLSKDINVALQEVQSSLARAQRGLPRDIDPPTISKSNPEDQPILWLSLSGDKPLNYMMEYTRDHLKDQFATIPGVGEVFLGGFAEPNLRVWLNAEKMREDELTVDDITSAIQSEHAEVPAGYIDTGKNEMNIRVVGEASSVKEFASIIIPSRRGSPLWKKFTIGDVAAVEEGTENIRRISRSMGKNTVGLGIRKQRGVNSVKVANSVKAKIKQMQKFLPEGLEIAVRFDTTVFIKESINDMYFVTILSVLLTGFVCWLFLGSFSSAVNVFLSIPMSICGTLFVMYILGFTLNMFTLLGLSLVIGIVVDDAIMVLENITRHREEGETKVVAAIKGAREITLAAVAATIAILAIFIPVIFMKDVIGKYFLQFGVTISVAVMISLLGALTLTPMYCSQYLTVGHTTG